MPELWTPVPQLPNDEFVVALLKAIANFAEATGVEKPLVEVELTDTSRFLLDHVDAAPGFGMVTLYVADARDDAPDALIVPLGSVRRIELRSGAGEERELRLQRPAGHVDEPGRDEQRHHVEPDVTARDAARRVPVGDPEPGQRRRPAPRPDRRPVQLERGDRDEDARVRRPPPRAPEEDEQERHADRAGNVRARQNGQPGDSPTGGTDGGDPDERPLRERPRERQPAEVDEPVRGRDEERQVVEAVVVDAPDERAGHLSDRCERDDAERLRARERHERYERRGEDGERHDAEPDLGVAADLRVRASSAAR